MTMQAIENLVFTDISKTELIDETIISLQSLLYETFKNKQKQISQYQFPKNTKVDDLRIKLDNVVVYIESLNSFKLSIEVIVDIFLNQSKSELGSFSHIFNEKGDLIDELLVIN